MSEAIARFREMALVVRCRSDAAFVSPVFLCAGMDYSLRGLKERLLAGRVPHTEFVDILRDAPSIKGAPSPVELLGQGRADTNSWFAQYRQPILAKAPRKADLDKQHAAALREAGAWGSLLLSVEKYLDALSETTVALREMAADTWLSRYSRTKARYAKTLLRWQRAYDALARFIEEPPALAATSGKQTGGSKQKKRRDRKRSGGRPAHYPMKFIREVFAAHERDKKHAAKAKQRLPAWAPWLEDYCLGNINIPEMFPPKFKGEPFQARAQRFKKAANKRLKG
jgi:hypothetical protein